MDTPFLLDSIKYIRKGFKGVQSQKCGCNPVVSHFGGKPLSIAGPGIIILWLVAAGLSVMAFDSGVTQESWNFVIAVWSHPIWPIAFAIAA